MSSLWKVLILMSLLAAGSAHATPNTPGQNQMNDVNRHTEYQIARDDCATQLGIVLPPAPHVNQQLEPEQRNQMISCMKQKGFTPRQAAKAAKQTAAKQTVSGQ